MPSKSRKKIKGQARKAKAKAAAAAAASSNNPEPEQIYTPINNCNHIVPCNSSLGDEALVKSFVVSFFNSFLSECSGDYNIVAINAATRALKNTHNKFPEAMNNKNNRDSMKNTIIATGVERLVENFFSNEFHDTSLFTVGCAVALMLFDSYDPSSPIPTGTFDDRDAKDYLTNIDVMNGCQRSLVKFFMKRVPCNCLDEMYAQLKITTPKMGDCINCHKRIERSKQHICTGCKRVMYCSKACQLAHVPSHKDECKRWQNGDYNAYNRKGLKQILGQTN